MLQGLGVAVPFRQPKIHTEHVGRLVVQADHEIGRFDVSVDQVPCMQGIRSFEHLIGNLQHCFQGKFTSAFVEQIFEG